jgi:hypothetical protein
MKSINLRAFCFLGGLILLSLGYQIFMAIRSEGFFADSNAIILEKAQIAFSHIPVDDKKAILNGLQSWKAENFSWESLNK